LIAASSGQLLEIVNPEFKRLLCDISTSRNSSPYFLRCYEVLCKRYTDEGNKNGILIGLNLTHQDSTAVLKKYKFGGYILGESILSRGSIIGDIYFVYVHKIYRGKGYASVLYNSFENVVIERSESVGIKSANIRITMKECIRSSVLFWHKQNFVGSDTSACLIKELKF
jgi:GNAT superfamily N-acetyltransferase